MEEGSDATMRPTILVIVVRTAIEACGAFVGLVVLGRYRGVVAL